MRWLERLTGSRAPPANPMDEASAAAKGGDYAAALALWEPLARAGVAGAQNNIGVCFSEGLGVERDPALAREMAVARRRSGRPIGAAQSGHSLFQRLGRRA